MHAHFAAYDARRGERDLALEAVARAQLEAAGVAAVHDTGLCTMCADPALFFSHRRDGGVTGRQAGVVWRRVTAASSAERASAPTPTACAPRSPPPPPRRPRPGRRRAPGGGEVRRPPRTSARSPRPASRSLGENRAQELEAKHAAHGDRFRWHFIGQLQSRKVKQILPLVELIHSVASDSALRQLERHGTPETEVLVEVNVAGEEGKAGIAPDDAAPPSSRAAPSRSRAHDDAAVRRRSRGQPAAISPPCASSPPSTACATSPWARRRTTRVAVEEGATIVRIGSVLFA